MKEVITVVVTSFSSILAALFASKYFWDHLDKKMDAKNKEKTAVDKNIERMVLGLVHDAIERKGEFYINRGWISPDEYKDLKDYLYDPYVASHGNGSAEKVMKEVDKLPLKMN